MNPAWNLIPSPSYSPKTNYSPASCYYHNEPPVSKDHLHAALEALVNDPRLLAHSRARFEYAYPPLEPGSVRPPLKLRIKLRSMQDAVAEIDTPPLSYSPITPAPPPKVQRLRLIGPEKPQGVVKKGGKGKATEKRGRK